jgi:electron transfer flavoprotein alpha subunit
MRDARRSPSREGFLRVDRSEFVVAINTDRDAPIGEVADVLVVADLKQFVPVLTERVRGV